LLRREPRRGLDKRSSHASGGSMARFNGMQSRAMPLVTNHHASALAARGAGYSPMGGQSMAFAPNQMGRQSRTDGSSLQELDMALSDLIGDDSLFIDNEKVLDLQDKLYERFMAKYRAQLDLDDQLTPDRLRLLQAIQKGDVKTIRSFIRKDFSWNFIFPPAKPSGGGRGDAASADERPHEAWCRSPLCLLVRPQDGSHLRTFVPGVDVKERHALIREVLAAGRERADPDFPAIYWASPAAHACFEGDVDTLDVLKRAGCDLTQKIEMKLQPRAAFTLAHAAAMQGHLHVLEYLAQHVPQGLFCEVDGDGNNALHVQLMHSASPQVIQFFLARGCDAFALNRAEQSPLSLAIETSPEIAETFLQQKSREETPWWGQQSFWFSFDGVELPQSSDRQPMRVKNTSGQPTTILELIIQHKAKNLIMTPLITDLIDLKWRLYGRVLACIRFSMLTCLSLSSWTAVCSDRDTLVFEISFVVFILIAVLLGVHDLLKVIKALLGNHIGVSLATYSDLAFLGLAVASLVVKWNGSSGYVVPISATIMGLNQLYLCVRILQVTVVFKFFGEMLISLFLMVEDCAKFAMVIAALIVGFANGIYALVHYGGLEETQLNPEVEFDFSYSGILVQLMLGLTGGGNLHDIVAAVPDSLAFGARVLFWSFDILGFLVMMNLLIAVLNTSYTKVDENTESEWKFNRLKVVLDLEHVARSSSIKSYFSHLSKFNNKRSTLKF